jgi:hypothetical protein
MRMAKNRRMWWARLVPRMAGVFAVCLFAVACGLPAAVRVSFANGQPTGFYLGAELLLLGWMIVLGQPLLFLAWLSNLPWLVAVFGLVQRKTGAWVKRCAFIGLVCAIPAVLPFWSDRWFGDSYARYWWFASHIALAAACWARLPKCDESGRQAAQIAVGSDTQHAHTN